MDAKLIRIFQIQIELYFKHILISRSQINEGLEKKNSVIIFFGIHNLLNAAANISKYYGGAMEKKPNRDNNWETASA